jgi:hypothetical protein
MTTALALRCANCSDDGKFQTKTKLRNTRRNEMDRMPIFTPADLPHNQEIVAAIEAGTREREKTEIPQPDRREGAALRQAAENSKEVLASLIREAEAAERGVVEATGAIATISKLKTVCQKQVDEHPNYNRSYRSDLIKADRALINAEENLVAAKRTLLRRSERLERHRAAMKDFMSHRPRPEWRTNKEVIADHLEQQKLEHSLRSW